MTQEKSEVDGPAVAEPAAKNSGLPGSSDFRSPLSLSSLSSLSLSSLPSAATASFPSCTSMSSESGQSCSDVPTDGAGESAITKELRRLNRALRALSACNRALGQAGSEQELLQQICDIIVQLGGYRTAFIAYAGQEEEKTVRRRAHAGYGEEYLENLALRWSDTAAGQGPAGTAIRDNVIRVVADI